MNANFYSFGCFRQIQLTDPQLKNASNMNGLRLIERPFRDHYSLIRTKISWLSFFTVLLLTEELKKIRLSLGWIRSS